MKKLSCQERREGIVQAAIQLFSEVGFHGSTTRALAKKAGISEALLFRHFPDKAILYEAILQKKMDEQLPFLMADLPVDKGPEALLKTLARRIKKLHEDDQSFLRLLLFSALENHELANLLFQKKTLPLVDFVEDFFKKSITDGSMQNIAPRMAALSFNAMVFGYLQTRLIFRIPDITKKSSDDWLDRYVDIFLKGILP